LIFPAAIAPESASSLPVGSVAPIPLRCSKTEKVLRGQTINDKLVEVAVKEFSREISPIDDIRSTKNYRQRVAENLLADFLSLEPQ